MPRCPTCHRRLTAEARCPADGSRAPRGVEVRALAPPRLAGYELGEPLGVGGFATTWAARRERDGREVAIKLSRRATLAARRRTEREAEMLRAAPPGVGPGLLGDGTVDGAPFLVLERLGGRPLSALLADAPAPLSLAAIQALGGALCEAVARLHEAGLCHGDLTPDNVLVDGERVVLVDFGLARRGRGAGADTTALAAGTPEYLAPERLRGAPADAAGDVYALGVLLYELATLRAPFVGDVASLEYGHSTLRPPPPSEHAAVAPDLEALILSCLAKAPRARPATARAVAEALSACVDGAARGAVVGDAAVTRGPVVLVAADLRRSIAETAELAAAHGAHLVWQRGDTVLWAVAPEARAPLLGARRLAGAAVALGGTRVALHVDTALVAHAGGAPLLAGEALLDVERWRPAGGWPGVRETDALAGLGAAGGESVTPLVGREELLARILDAARACFADERPTLLTITGAAGSGKSRLADELAARLAALAADGAVLRERAPAVDPHEGGELLRDRAALAPLAVVVDDAHQADGGFLDALEYATLPGEELPLLAVVLAAPRFAHHRPAFGERAARALALELAPLDERDAIELLTAALAPCDYPPEAALRELVGWCGGAPGDLIAVARALIAAGLVRDRPGGGRTLATGSLPSLARSPLWSWIAERELASLPAELAALARLCALLAPGFPRDEVEDVVAAVERRVGGRHADVDVGLFHLRERGLLVADGEALAFARPALAAALAAAMPGDRRAVVDEVALARWRGRSGEGGRALRAIAHHAAALEHDDEAAAAHALLGEEAHRCHRPVDADRHHAAALARAADPALRARCLLGRGRARYRLDRSREAIDDLAAAARLARELGDDTLAAEALLEEATALDWAQDFAASAERVDAAAALAVDARLEAPLALGRGRSAWRREEVAEAVELLTTAAEASAAAGDHDTRVVSLLLLGPALVRAGRLEEAEACFEQLIALCEPAGDRLHLCAAHGNRMFLWSALEQPERARDDLRAAMRLARQVGHPKPERVATYNLAEDLYWSGEDDDEALALAERARDLARRYVDVPVAEDALLVARVALATGRRELAAAEVAWVRAHVPRLSPSASRFAELVELVLRGGTDEEFVALCRAAEPVLGADDFLELVYWRARSALAAGRHADAHRALAEARARAREVPIWQRRIADLAGAS